MLAGELPNTSLPKIDRTIDQIDTHNTMEPLTAPGQATSVMSRHGSEERGKSKQFLTPLVIKDHDVDPMREVLFKKVIGIGRKEYLIEISKNHIKQFIVA